MIEPPTARRDRYAAAIRRRIKDLTGPKPLTTGHFQGGASEYDLAHVAITLADRDIAAVRAEFRDLLRTESKRADDAIARETTADAAADELRAERDQLAVVLGEVLDAFWAVKKRSGEVIETVGVQSAVIRLDDFARWQAALAPMASTPVQPPATACTCPTGVITTDHVLSPVQAAALRTAFPGAPLDAPTEIVVGGVTYRYDRLPGGVPDSPESTTDTVRTRPDTTTTEDLPMPGQTARAVTSFHDSRCPSGQHYPHPDMTCEQVGGRPWDPYTGYRTEAEVAAEPPRVTGLLDTINPTLED